MDFVDLKRSFVPVDKDREPNLDIGWAWGRKIGGWLDWNGLLQHRRVILLAEASSGKTQEFRSRATVLTAEGKPAFFVRVEDLADDGFEAALENSVAAKVFQEWRDQEGKAGAADAWFFLDSVDEARLNNKSLDRALRRFARELDESVGRARVFVSCRVSDWKGADDRDAVMRLLPVHDRPAPPLVPDEPEAALLDPIFKERPRSREHLREKARHHDPNALIVVQLVPLAAEQRNHLAAAAGVANPDLFAQGITQNGLDSLADRPGDLLDLAEYWNAHRGFGSLSEMTEHGVSRKLAERVFRPDNRDLDPRQAREGAERVAAALKFGKSFALRAPGHDPDPALATGALDPAVILPEWTEAKRNALTRRGVFAPSTYGRVRFHHRGTQEYLAASWLRRLLEQGCPRSAVHDLLFTASYGLPTVVPSLQATAAWLARDHPDIRDELIRREPLVLLRHGDPRSLPRDIKERLLLTYGERHAAGEISDDSLDHRALSMFATPDLSDAVRRAWASNAREDFRSDLLRLVREAPIPACADLARDVVADDASSDYLREMAVQALEGCADHAGLAAATHWLKEVGEGASARVAPAFAKVLFPRHLSVEDLLAVIARSPPPRRGSLEGFGFALEQLWQACSDDRSRLTLCEGLAQLCLTPPFVADYRRVSARFKELAKDLEPIARNALQRFRGDVQLEGLVRLLMAVERSEERGSSRSEEADLPRLSDLVNERGELKRRLFWADVEETRRNASREDRPYAFWHIHLLGGALWCLSPADLFWLEEDLRAREHEDDKRIALSALVSLLVQAERDGVGEGRTLISEAPRLRTLIAGHGEKLAEDLERHLAPSPPNDKTEQRRTRRDAHAREVQERENKASWIKFKEELASDPKVLRELPRLADWASGSSKLGTLTRWLRDRTGADYEEAARRWRLLEEGFGRAVAEAYRDGMKALWRITTPERPLRRNGGHVTEKYTIILSVAGLGLEASEDPEWAARLSRDEAERAAKHARLSERGHPDWMEALVAHHPSTALPVFREMLLDEWSGRHLGRSDALGQYARSERPIPAGMAEVLVEVLTGPLPGGHDALDRGLRVLARLDLAPEQRARIRRLALRRLRAAQARHDAAWVPRHLGMLFQVDPDTATAELVLWLDQTAAPLVNPLPARVEALDVEADADDAAAVARASTPAERVLAILFGREDDLRCARALARASVASLESLVRLAYSHVRPEDDMTHEGGHTRGSRDAAEGARNTLLGALLNRSGADAYRAMRSLAADSAFQGRAIRFNELAHGKAERDAEPPAWTPAEVIAFEDSHAAPAKTGDALIRIIMGVLDDIGSAPANADASSRRLLQRAVDEDEVQEWLAEQLNLRAKNRYHAHREAQVAGGDKPDIIIASTAAPVEVAVEVKHGGKGWSVRELEGALTRQLAEAYLKPAQRRHGVLLVSHHGRRTWRAPEDNTVLTFTALTARLQKLAETKVTNALGAIEVRAFGLDASGEVKPAEPRRTAPRQKRAVGLRPSRAGPTLET